MVKCLRKASSIDLELKEQRVLLQQAKGVAKGVDVALRIGCR